MSGPGLIWSSAYAVLLALVVHLMSPAVTDMPRYYEGQTIRHAVVPRVEFTSVNTFETERRREDAFNSQQAVYKPYEPLFKKVRTDLGNLLKLGTDANIETIEQIPVETRKMLHLDEAALRELIRINQDEAALKAWNEKIDRLINELLPGIAVLRHEQYEAESGPVSPGIMIKPPRESREMWRGPASIHDVTGDVSAIRETITKLMPYNIPQVLSSSIIQVITDNLLRQPTYVRDEAETERRRKAAQQRVELVEIRYRTDDVLVLAGQKLSDLDLKLLQAEHAAAMEKLGPQKLWLMWAARFGLLLLITGGLWTYILAYNAQVRRNPMRGLAITVLMALSQIAAVYATGYRPEFLLVTAVFPTLFVTMVLAITYDQRFALAMGMIHAAIVAVSLALPIDVAVTMLLGVAVSCTLLNEVRTRSKLVTTGTGAGLMMGFASGLFAIISGVLQFDDGWQQVTSDTVIAFCAGAGAGIFVQAILVYIEKLFHVTTAMTLKELNDATLPLLRRLAEEAPGTYRHSLTIADMSENAALSIDADGLLCRVGAMYHDIGKINKPNYFVENQGGGPNRHDKLSPAMSLLIIVGHVKDGVEMAREYGLPPVIRHFIESHHGTTLVEYFYHAARQQTKDTKDEQAPLEFSFRYPGPKPQTREAAILMLCDGIEGAARAMSEPTPVRLEQLVHAMANKRLMDGQFDECSITLQELHRIEESIIKTLCSIYHGRIKYPDAKSGDAPTKPAIARA